MTHTLPRPNPALALLYLFVPAWLFWLIESLIAALTCWRWQLRRDWHARHAAYLRSLVWRIKRVRMIYGSGCHCELCSKRERLQVHHARYRRVFGFELDTDLTVLCAAHHAMAHGRRP